MTKLLSTVRVEGGVRAGDYAPVGRSDTSLWIGGFVRTVLRNSLLFLSCALPAFAIVAGVGDEIELRATHHLGVPLHRIPAGTQDFQRVPDGARASVLEVVDSNWHRVRVNDGREGWIVSRYVNRVITPASDHEHDEELVWGSSDGCDQVVSAGRRMPKDDTEALLVGTWNIRWFNRGCSGNESCPENQTDVDWAACAITWMGVDVLALQEILTTAEAQIAMDELVAELESLTGEDWSVDLQSCGSEARQHVGFLINLSAVDVETAVAQDVWELNGDSGAGPGSACASALRPGRFLRVKAKSGGADFNLLSVHLDSGTDDRDYLRRRTALGRLPTAQIGGQDLADIDIDNVVIGDFNTMGKDETTVVSAAEEIAVMDFELGDGFQRLPPSFACSEYFNGEGGLLDHVVVATGMSEAATSARVTGYCAVLQCAPFASSPPPAYNVLSDHCPIVFEITDSDVD